MVTSDLGRALWSKLAAAPPGWLDSPDGRRLGEKAVALLKERGEAQDAEALANLLTLGEVFDKLGLFQ